MLNGAYIAYPIDQRGPASLAHLFDQIERFKQMLIENEIVDWTFDPGDAFNVSVKARPTDRLPRINRVALINADVVVAFLPKGVASVGVPMEIDRAVQQGKYVIVFSDAHSWMLTYPPGNKRIYRAYDYDVEDLDFAAKWLAQQPPLIEERPKQELPTVVHDEGCLPRRAYDDDAGLDLVVSQDVTILPGQFEDVPCGVSVELPEWSWGLVTGRSSALRKKGLLVHSGVIDAGYRGPLYAGAWNMTDETVTVKAGERIAQLIVISNQTRNVEPWKVESLTPSARGERGFGSSGA